MRDKTALYFDAGAREVWHCSLSGGMTFFAAGQAEPCAARNSVRISRHWCCGADGQMIAVIDTGICNLRSVTKALEAVGATIQVVRTPEEIVAADARGIVLPGVGALRDCVASLRASKLDTAVRDWIAADQPFLGVCLGMQALFEHSEEGNITGLGIFPGKVVRFQRPPEFKIPHMGWNTVRFVQPNSPLAANLAPDGENFYFVHSFHCVPVERSLVLAECGYGGSFVVRLPAVGCLRRSFTPKRARRRACRFTAISRRWWRRVRRGFPDARGSAICRRSRDRAGKR